VRMPVTGNKKIILNPGDAVFYRFDSKLGFWGIPNMEGEVFFKPIGDASFFVRHNEQGNRDKSYPRKNAGKTIVCFGGSHTWGVGIEQELRYTDLLEGMLSDTTVVNLGHCSLGLDQICLKLMGDIQDYSPSIVVVEQYPWSIHRVLNNYVNGYLKPFFFLDQEDKPNLKKLSRFSKYKSYRKIIGSVYAYQKEFGEFKAGIDLKRGYDPLTDPIFLYWKIRHYDYMYNLVDKILFIMKDFCHQKNIKLIFALGAILQQFGPKSRSQLVDYDLPGKRLINLLDKNRIPYVDMSDTMIAQHTNEDPVLFPDGHMNAKGHLIFAGKLRESIEKMGWYPA
jgi:hypothetical protein